MGVRRTHPVHSLFYKLRLTDRGLLCKKSVYNTHRLDHTRLQIDRTKRPHRSGRSTDQTGFDESVFDVIYEWFDLCIIIVQRSNAK